MFSLPCLLHQGVEQPDWLVPYYPCLEISRLTGCRVTGPPEQLYGDSQPGLTPPWTELLKDPARAAGPRDSVHQGYTRAMFSHRKDSVGKQLAFKTRDQKHHPPSTHPGWTCSHSLLLGGCSVRQEGLVRSGTLISSLQDYFPARSCFRGKRTQSCRV